MAGLDGMDFHVVTALVRSGTVQVTVANFDVVDGTSFFRQCYLSRDVGFSKTDAIYDALAKIEPDMDLKEEEHRFGPDNACGVFSGCVIVCECLI